MVDGLVFGWRSAVLLTALAPLIPLIFGLAGALHNRLANRALAGLLLVLAGIVTPWMIGFAGFYDRWPGLSHVPFSLSLAVMPLLWIYTVALTTGHLPSRFGLHLVPALLQAALKVLPALTGPVPGTALLADVGLVAGLAGYSWLSYRALSRYRQVLLEQRSDPARYAAHWLARAIAAVGLLLLLTLGHKVWGAVRPLGYEGLMGLHIAIAGVALYLGVEGWRTGSQPVPTFPAGQPPPPPRPGRDWRALGEDYRRQIEAAGWVRDPGLTLSALAQHLGTNTSYLSRALNEGLRTSFSDFVNQERSRIVAAMLDEGRKDSLLDLALEAGFASKATFNRAFQHQFGCSPSAYRQRLKR
ncbi:AraC family transcriptional regulator [Brevundimonas sp. A19_0]|uniref:helix-turn-helix domain-containing protein n=1 Tax=Brevundimonas sp. A19_0 TaxID=2821087 RepID=UPI001ADA1E40|nr:AraC family transcriptional regulator [Brevundimonas sp. A19_0]MBO9501588.1 helix-turn-helix transcriptional regulator [Brevundimonas sp. A19_0]